MSGVYVLELIDNKRYVGMSENIAERITKHISGNGASFTKKYKVIKQGDLLTKQDGSLESWECNETLAQMIKYGINNVRGFQWINNEISKEDAYAIKSQMCGLFSLCNICGKPGHYSNECLNHSITEHANWMNEINNLTKNNKDIMADLINQTEKIEINDTETKPYKREKAVSGRSKCQKCKQSIQKDTFRIGVESTYKGQPTTKWFHDTCYFENNTACTPVKEPEKFKYKIGDYIEFNIDEQTYRADITNINSKEITINMHMLNNEKIYPPHSLRTIYIKNDKLIWCVHLNEIEKITVLNEPLPSKYTQKIFSNKSPQCDICGRKGHTSSQCYATTTIDGDYIDSNDEFAEVWQCGYCNREFDTEKGAKYHEMKYCKKRPYNRRY